MMRELGRLAMERVVQRRRGKAETVDRSVCCNRGARDKWPTSRIVMIGAWVSRCVVATVDVLRWSGAANRGFVSFGVMNLSRSGGVAEVICNTGEAGPKATGICESASVDWK